MPDAFICEVCNEVFDDISDMRFRQWQRPNGSYIRHQCCKYCIIVPPCPRKESGIHGKIWVASEDLAARDKTDFKSLEDIPINQKGICSDCHEVHVWSVSKQKWLTIPELAYRVVI